MLVLPHTHPVWGVPCDSVCAQGCPEQWNGAFRRIRLCSSKGGECSWGRELGHKKVTVTVAKAKFLLSL